MRRLFLRIYVAVLTSLILFVLLAGLSLKLLDWDDEDSDHEMAHVVTELAGELLPANSRPDLIQSALDRWHRKFNANLSVHDNNGTLLAWSGDQPLEAPDARMRKRARNGKIWVRAELGPQLLMALPGGRYLGAIDSTGARGWRSGPKGILFIVGLLSLVGVAVAIVAWPVTRRLTQRLEQLQVSVEEFGQGDLSVRANANGKDEVGRLAASFNQSADHIEQLVAGQRTLLANASHELRSPLARIRMAAELMTPQPDNPSADTDHANNRYPAADELLRNVGELDALVDEILLASRLDTQSGAHNNRSEWTGLDLGGLVAEEGARCGLVPEVSSMPVVADARLLRRLVRNLIENAMRYGVQSDAAVDIAIRLSRSPEHIVLSVCDRGRGVPVDEREKIFEAFYRAPGASERSGGVGLGLSLVRQIVRHHGGDVSCDQRAGGGSCFVARFPVSMLDIVVQQRQK